jgi:hypothetical protein
MSPGKGVAKETIFMVLATIVWGLNVRKEKEVSWKKYEHQYKMRSRM